MSKHWSITAIFISAYCLLCAEPSKLASKSPFLPPGYSTQKPLMPQKPVTQKRNPLANDFEFRGIVQLDRIYQFSLFKKSENKSYWIAENESENGILISDFDLDNMSITLSADGQSEQLTLMAASETPTPVVTGPAPTINTNPVPPVPNQATIKSTANKNTRRTIPRRRVILPKK